LNDFGSPVSTLPPSEPRDEDLAPPSRFPWHYLYTFFIVGVVLFFSWAGADKQADAAASRGHVVFYLSTIGAELILLALTYPGLRLAGMTLKETIGGRWKSVEDFLLDLAIALIFWLVSYAVLIGLAFALHMASPGAIDKGKDTIMALAPKPGLELTLWLCMSAVAGFVEEIVYRGYFQQQFGRLLRNIWPGMLLSAAVFGLSHGYEGGKRMFLIFIFGAMFGTLAIWRKSLRPGMIAHGWHDGISGVLLVIAQKLMKSGVLK
jgi:membrane protease YdiL (CAAX protease family)